jgi:hypothetical protein
LLHPQLWPSHSVFVRALSILCFVDEIKICPLLEDTRFEGMGGGSGGGGERVVIKFRDTLFRKYFGKFRKYFAKFADKFET